MLAVAPGGDLNGDSVLNVNDWATFLDNHLADLSGYTPAERAARGDLNGDGEQRSRRLSWGLPTSTTRSTAAEPSPRCTSAIKWSYLLMHYIY